MAKILILTAGYGEGHNSAARALLQAFAERPGVDAELVDLFALHSPRLNDLSRRGYLKVINSAPKLWSWTYRWLDRSPLVPHLFKALSGHRQLLARLIEEKKPTALVSTYPVYGWLLNQLQREGRVRCPQFTVVTDALTINSLWYRARADGWFVTDRDSGSFMVAQGVPAKKVHLSGFPVALRFPDRPPAWQPPTPASGAKFRVLFMINSAAAPTLRIARALVRHADWQITFTAGRNERLLAELRALGENSPADVEVLGWTDRIPELLMTHHVVISKAGGATTQESINALCPLIVSQIVPGQEEGNYELIRRNEAGALAETPDAIVATIERAAKDNAAVWLKWRTNLQRIAQPAAARSIVRTVLAAAETRTNSTPPFKPTAAKSTPVSA